MKRKVREWIELAGTDLAAAKKLIDDESLTPIVSFHVHQCIEKSFKAILEKDERPIPKIHDLIRLHHEIDNLKIFFGDENIDEDILDDLSRLYIDSRYPALTGYTPYGRPSVDDAKRYLEAAELIFSGTIKLVETK